MPNPELTAVSYGSGLIWVGGVVSLTSNRLFTSAKRDPRLSTMVRKRGHVYMNPRSQFVEEEVIEGLTLYEINRHPRILELSESSTISIPTDELTAEIGCPICTGTMKETHIVAECLHRFCRTCIQFCIYQGQKGCPICRTKLPSKRSLRSDPKFDSLVRALIPNLEKFDEALDNAAMNYNISKIDQLTEKAFSEDSIAKQRSKRPRRRRTQESSKGPTAESPKSVVKSPEFVHFQLHRHPDETALPLLRKKFLRTQGGCTARHILKFLHQKLNTEELKLQLCMDVGERRGGVIHIDDPVTVLRAKADLWKDIDREMVILYRLAPSTSG
eukprot:189038_1